jgi:1-phosphofructokinase
VDSGLNTTARVAVFGPHPLLTVTVETLDGTVDDVHFHAGGQGVWVARMADELGARTVLCGFVGGETGTLLESLLGRMGGEQRLVTTAGPSGCYVIDRRNGKRNAVAQQLAAAPSRHELDDLVSTTCAAALESDVLVVCNPYPGDVLPLEVYGKLVADVRANGTPVLVDLSSPRLENALTGSPDLVKLNDWELAELVCGSVERPEELRAAAEHVRDLGAAIVVVTRGAEPAFVLHGEDAFELVPPHFELGSREGCGDSMIGALAAGWASGLGWQDALVLGAAAGAANFLRHGLGSGARKVVDDLAHHVTMRPLLAPRPLEGLPQ